MSNIGNQTDEAWERIFNDYNILSEIESKGYYIISADTIKKYREPRLMAKFDHSINLPKIFSDNKLAILPTTRGKYIIAHFDAYHEFEQDAGEITSVSLPSYIQSIDCNNIINETMAINSAAISGILDDFIEDREIRPTVAGRMSSGSFIFSIDDVSCDAPKTVEVMNSQIEIDAAYEGIESFAIIEAKRVISDDFLIRQLYYPYRTWQDKIAKPVRPIFLVYSNGIFNLYEYAFTENSNYCSLTLVKHKRYSIEDTTITSDDIQHIIDTTSIMENEPEVPFPQANSFERVINICELVSENPLSKDELTEQYAFDGRQTQYYTDAAIYLGLLKKEKDEDKIIRYSLTEKGKRVFRLGYKKRQLAICRTILCHRAFNRVFKSHFETGVMPSDKDIVEIMKQCGLYMINQDSTYYRRASTVKGWINWIIGLINDY